MRNFEVLEAPPDLTIRPLFEEKLPIYQYEDFTVNYEVTNNNWLHIQNVLPNFIVEYENETPLNISFDSVFQAIQPNEHIDIKFQFIQNKEGVQPDVQLKETAGGTKQITIKTGIPSYQVRLYKLILKLGVSTSLESTHIFDFAVNTYLKVSPLFEVKSLAFHDPVFGFLKSEETQILSTSDKFTMFFQMEPLIESETVRVSVLERANLNEELQDETLLNQRGEKVLLCHDIKANEASQATMKTLVKRVYESQGLSYYNSNLRVAWEIDKLGRKGVFHLGDVISKHVDPGIAFCPPCSVKLSRKEIQEERHLVGEEATFQVLIEKEETHEALQIEFGIFQVNLFFDFGFGFGFPREFFLCSFIVKI